MLIFKYLRSPIWTRLGLGTSRSKQELKVKLSPWVDNRAYVVGIKVKKKRFSQILNIKAKEPFLNVRA